MATAELKNLNGSVVGQVEFNSALFDATIVPQLLRDAYVMYEANLRQGTAKTKTKGEISGSKKKLFRQKGTGNARMGQKRTPVRVGGGNAFGKKPKDWSYRLPKKALRVATRMALAGKLKCGEVIILEQLYLDKPKTSAVAKMLKALGIENKRCLIVTDGHDNNLRLSTRNIPKISQTTSLWLNSHDLLRHRAVVMTQAAFKSCLARFTTT